MPLSLLSLALVVLLVTSFNLIVNADYYDCVELENPSTRVLVSHTLVLTKNVLDVLIGDFESGLFYNSMNDGYCLLPVFMEEYFFIMNVLFHFCKGYARVGFIGTNATKEAAVNGSCKSTTYTAIGSVTYGDNT